MLTINLTQHISTPDQRAAGVVDLPPLQRAMVTTALTFETIEGATDLWELDSRVLQLVQLAGAEAARLRAGQGAENPLVHVMVGGAPWIVAPLVRALGDMPGVRPVYAFSQRASEDQPQPDGSVKKVTTFKHVGFVDAR